MKFVYATILLLNLTGCALMPMSDLVIETVDQYQHRNDCVQIGNDNTCGREVANQ